MSTLIMTRAVIKTRTVKVQFAEQGPVDYGVLPFPGPLRATVGADFELCYVFLDLFGDHGLLHAMQQCLCLRKRQA
jgi:hypothetical protein